MTLNLFKVNDNIWRSGQPLSQDWAELHALGIRKILKLNEMSVGSDHECVAFGMTLYVETIGDQASQVEIDPAILLPIDARLVEPGPWLVHCAEGKDRTGIAIARFRVMQDGWTKEAAYDEWVRYGSHRYRGLEDAWRDWVPPTP
jgi:protein tyrosine/serine phosphatase